MTKKYQKISLYFILIFLLFTIFYNGISTFVNFGLDLNIPPSLIAGIRDGGWFLFIIIVFLLNIKRGIQIIKKNLFFMFFLLGFSVFGFLLSYLYHGKTFYEIIVGFKSTTLPFFFFLSSIVCGELIFGDKNIKNNISSGINFTKSSNTTTLYSQQQDILYKTINILLQIIIIGGILRQLGKILFPDFFYSIGYGPIGDRHFNQNPPIYYRTGPGGWMRFSGLFAGPNNYGYFLVLFFPFVVNLFLNRSDSKNISFGKKIPEKQKLEKTSDLSGNNKLSYKKKFFTFTPLYFSTLFILSGIITLSRGVFVGRGFQILLFLPTIWNKYKHILQKHKKLLFGLGILSVLFFVLLSYEKIGSTIEHFDKRTEGRHYIIIHPIRGYGRGTSGPAFHFGGKIIPENFYFQLWIDLGIFGLLGRIGLRIFIWKKYHKYDKKNLFFGLFGLFIVGLFLHIWEDSMVNDLFFVIRGLFLGYDISNTNKEKSINKGNKNILSKQIQ